MSFNSHKRKLLDESEQFSYRASRARSCALLVARKMGLTRDAVIDLVASRTGIDLYAPQSVSELLIALEELECMRRANSRASIP